MEYTLNCNGRLLSLEKPCVMGILNVTPDSFYAASRVQTEQQIALRAQAIIDEGGTIIDIGACSTRPGSESVGAQEEMERLCLALAVVRREVPDAIISVDTFRPDIARMTVEEYGAAIINDVSGPAATVPQQEGSATGQGMTKMVSRLGVPYVYMSHKATMSDILLDCAEAVDTLRSTGQKDIIVDPGFGFGKTQEQNYTVMNQLERMHLLRLPVLVGVSRKSMIYRLLDTEPSAALNGTSVLNTVALLKGASILRVHDVKAAVECIQIVQSLK